MERTRRMGLRSMSSSEDAAINVGTVSSVAWRAGEGESAARGGRARRGRAGRETGEGRTGKERGKGRKERREGESERARERGKTRQGSADGSGRGGPARCPHRPAAPPPAASRPPASGAVSVARGGRSGDSPGCPPALGTGRPHPFPQCRVPVEVVSRSQRVAPG